jgi:hypothetical protein
MTKKSTVIALAAVILTASAFGFNGVALAETNTSASSWKESQKYIKDYLKHAPGIIGSVSAVNGNQITVTARNKITYTIDTEQAKIFKNRNTLITVADIKVGDTIMAQGTFNGTTITATTLFDGKPLRTGKKGHSGAFPGVMGTVSANNGTTFSITTKDGALYTVATTSATKIWKGSPAVTSTISNIANGDIVMARGQVVGQTVTAEEIFDGVNPKQY